MKISLLRSIGGGEKIRFNFHCIVVCMFIIHGTHVILAHGVHGTSNQTNHHSENTCSTEVCVDAATDIYKNLNDSVDPCDNFYEFVCGNFGREAQGLNESGQVDQFSMISDHVQQQIMNLVDKDVDAQEPRTFKLIKTYYQSCLNTTQIERKGLESLQDVLTKLGGWPVVLGDAWNEHNFTWQRIDQILQSLGYNPKYIFHIFVSKDVQNSSRNILYIGPSETELKDIWHDENIVETYKDYMIDVAVLLGADRNRAKSELNEALSFQMKLLYAKYSASQTEETIVDYVKIKNLQIVHPYVPWLEYLNNITTYKFQEDDEVYIEDPIYLQGARDVLANSTKRVIANYILWRAIEDSVDYLTDEITNKRLSFDRARSGTTGILSRKKKCLQAVASRNGGFLPGISAMYVKEFFNNGTKDRIAKMVDDIRRYYMDTLKKSSDFSQKMTKTALRKNELMKEVIGYPTELVDMDFLEKYYEKLNIEPNQFFESSLMLQRFLYEKSFDRLMKSPNETFWIDVGVSADVQVYYHALYNAIVLPASVLQYPFFDKNQPNYLNYGSSGFLIGHEISHAFVFGEVPTDEYGIVRMWWTMEDQEVFRTKAQCLTLHYNNFTDGTNDTRIRRKAINEIIADNEGIKAAISAYKSWKLQNGDEKSLASLNYTNEQLFWISTANTLCTRRTEEIRKYLSITDEHPTEELRINGVLSNSLEFSQAFKCPIGTRMNPEQKCMFWK